MRERRVKPYAFSLCIVLGTGAADAAYFTHDIYGAYLDITDDSIVAPDIELDFKNIVIQSSVYINNQGIISGNVFISDGCDAYIQNSGQIDGEITAGANTHLTQLVRSAHDITELNIAAPYDIMIYHAADVGWTDILGISGAADKIILVESGVMLTPNMMMRLRGVGTEIELVGHNDFYIKSDELDLNNPILSHVTGDGTVHLHVREPIDSMYALQSFVHDGNLYAKLVRETDYVKILNNDMGRFLNALRLHSPDDNLLHALDGAASLPELHGVMHESMRLNTARLNRPLMTFNRNLAAASFDQPLFSVPYVIMGDNMNAYGLQAGINLNPTPHSRLSFGAHSAYVAFTDGIDDYDGELSGISAAWHYNGNRAFAAAHAGATFARLNTPELFDDDAAKHNPHGRAMFLNLDIGPKYNLNKEFYLAPIAGLGGEYAHVLKSDKDVFARTGLLSVYEYKTSDLYYRYSLQLSADTHGRRGATAGIGFTSPDDKVSLRLTAGFTHDEMGRTYTIATLLQFGF